jgi:hypothetical protein
MTKVRGRFLKASAALGAAGAGVALAAGPAAAAGTPTVTPTTGLHDGQSVSVTWDTGLSFGVVAVGAVECSSPVPAGEVTTSLSQCDLDAATNLPLVQGTTYQGNVAVKKSLNTAAGAVTCTNQCSIVVIANILNFGGDSSGSVPITFK